MAKMRKFVAYRRLESRPNTRKSKYRSKAFNRSVPVSKIVKYDLGNLQRTDFPCIVYLKAFEDCQIRSNALESARQSCTRLLEAKAPKDSYHIQVRAYPHHIMRENPLATGAGADRLSTGMKNSYGVAIGVAARMHAGQAIIAVYCDKVAVEAAKIALRMAKMKLPCACKIDVEEKKLQPAVAAV